MAKNKNAEYEEVKPSKMELNLEMWTKKNRNLVYGVLGAVILIPLLWFGYQEYVAKPKAKEAAAAMFMAENYFALDSFNLALNGNAEFSGFLGIIDEYKNTPSGNLAHYYAGICYYNLEDFETALDMMKGFKTKDLVLYGISNGFIGDCYTELGNFEEAVNYYEKATKKHANELSTPIYLRKAGQIYEVELNNPDKAIELYERVIYEFPNSGEVENCTKFAERAKAGKG